MANAWLEIQAGPDAGRRLDLPADAEEILLGRSPECGVVVAAPSVSRKHARLVRVGERFRVEDLGSANGTQVNGKRLSAPVEVGDQDRITLGSVEMLLVSPPAEAPEPDATITIPPGADATIAVTPGKTDAGRTAPGETHPGAPAPGETAPGVTAPGRPEAPEPPPPAVEPPPPAEAPAPPPPPADLPRPWRQGQPGTAASELTPTRPTPDLAAARTPARSGGPGIVELLAIGAASFLAVYGLGWLLG